MTAPDRPWHEWRSLALDGPPTEDGLVVVFAPSCDPECPLKQNAWYTPNHDSPWSLLPDVWAAAITHWMPLSPDPQCTTLKQRRKAT